MLKISNPFTDVVRIKLEENENALFFSLPSFARGNRSSETIEYGWNYGGLRSGRLLDTGLLVFGVELYCRGVGVGGGRPAMEVNGGLLSYRTSNNLG